MEDIWKKIHFQIEHQLYDLELDDEDDTAEIRASMAVDNIKAILKNEGYKLVKDDE